MNVVFTVVALLLMDKVARRPLLLAGVAGQIVGLVILGIVFEFRGCGIFTGYIAIVALAINVGAFATGLGPVFWLMISEIYPLKVRSTGMSIATVTNWGFNLLVAVTFLTLVEFLGRPGAFWLYGAIGVVSWIFHISARTRNPRANARTD